MLQQTLHAPIPGSRFCETLNPLMNDIVNCVRIGEMPWITIPHQVHDLATIEALAREYRAACDHVVLCGTGGSSLGARALAELVEHPLRLSRKGMPQLHIVESTDSEMLEAVLHDLPADRTGWIFISKSGTTLETVTQFLVYLAWRRTQAQTGPVTVVTMPGARPMRDMAVAAGIRVLDHPPALGGRFSVLSLVGLLPAAILGVDITALRQGAATMLEPENLYIAAQAACWQVECMRQGRSIQIVMPYARRLNAWTLWYRQLWAESLGKDGHGSTPMNAVGPVDQHSMLQLFLDGPADKSVTTVSIDAAGHAPLDITAAPEDYAYLAPFSGEEIVGAQAYGTVQAMLNRELPLREIRLPQLDAQHLGALLMLGMLETVMAAELLGVDAFDQPAVEEGKRVTFALLKGEMLDTSQAIAA